MVRRRRGTLLLFVLAPGGAVAEGLVDLPTAWRALIGASVSLALAVTVYAAHRAAATRRLRALGHGLDQRSSLGYVWPNHIVLSDSAGTVWLRRGSVALASREGPLLTLKGDGFAHVVLSDLVDDDDLGFLENREGARAKPDIEPPLPLLPHPCEIPVSWHRDIKRFYRRRSYASPLAVMLTSSGLLVLGVGVLAAYAAGPVLAWLIVLGIPGITAPLLTGRDAAKRACQAWPAGIVMNAGMDQVGVTARFSGVTWRIPWSAFGAHRLSPELIVLRPMRPFAGQHRLLPTAIFSRDDLRVVRDSVPRF